MEKENKKNGEQKTKDLENKEQVIPVNNDIRVIIKSKEDGVLFDQDCCTVINIILNNYNEIATSFLGIHSEAIIKQLWKAQKAYFKALKKTLKEERKRASEIAKNEENSDNGDKSTKPIKENKDDIYHIKEFGKSESDPATDPEGQEGKQQVINSDTDKFEHVCDENGCRLIKKRIDPKTSAETSLHKPSQKKISSCKTNRKSTSKSTSNKSKH